MQRGFSLIEILITLGLVLTMGVIAVSGYASLEQRAKINQVSSDFTALITMLDREVSTGVISDYRILFSHSASGIVIERNAYQLESPLEILSFNWQSYTGSAKMGSASGYIIESPGLPPSVQESSSLIESFALVHSGNRLSTLEGFTGEIHKNKFEFILFSDLFPSLQIQTLLCTDVATIDKCILSNTRGKRDYVASPVSIPPGNTITFLGKTESIEYTLRL